MDGNGSLVRSLYGFPVHWMKIPPILVEMLEISDL